MARRAQWSHEVELKAEAVSASGARRFVRRHLSSHGLPSMVDDVELVVSELATNALTHAATPFRVSVARFDQVVLLEVTDRSPAVPRRVRSGPLDTAGRGVFLVGRVSSDWGTRDLPGAGKTVWASFDAP